MTILAALRASGFSSGLSEGALCQILILLGEEAPQGATLEDLRQMLERKADEHRALLKALERLQSGGEPAALFPAAP